MSEEGFCELRPPSFFSLAAAAHAEQQKLAVLEFEVQKGGHRPAHVQLGIAERRGRPRPNFFVMTHANIETLMRAASKTLAGCE